MKKKMSHLDCNKGIHYVEVRVDLHVSEEHQVLLELQVDHLEAHLVIRLEDHLEAHL